jgi:hypothetical protein
VPEHAATRLIENEVSEMLIVGDEAGLLPDCVARRRQDAAHNHIADLAFRVAGDHVDHLCAVHLSSFSKGSVSSESPHCTHPIFGCATQPIVICLA